MQKRFRFIIWYIVLLLPAAGSFADDTVLTADTLTTTSPINLAKQRDVVISGIEISAAPDNCILLTSCESVLITRCHFNGALGEGVHLIGCTSITIEHCRFDNVRTGVYAVDCQSIRVNDCRFQNVVGPMPRGQFVQFDKVQGFGNSVSRNIGLNEPGQSNPEDAINIYMSGGTSESKLIVEGNRIRGGGPSPSGGGIMIGDQGGSNIVVRNNQLVDPGQYGIAVAGGTNIQLLNNKIFGSRQAFTNVGLYIWNQGAHACGQITVQGNEVCWINKAGAKNSCWNAGNCGEISGWGQNSWDHSLTVPPEFPDVSM